MSKYKIKQDQTGLDVVNNTFASQDNIYDLYVNNSEFNINLMQNQSVVDYTASTNKTINDIVNNQYIFKNSNVEIFKSLFTLKLNIGTFIVPQISLYDNGSIVNVDVLISNSETNEMNIYNSTEINEISLFETENNITVNTDVLPDEEIYNIINIGGSDSITDITLKDVKVAGAEVKLYINDLPVLNSYDFLNNITILDAGLPNQVVHIDASRSLITSGNMNLFLSKLVSSGLSQMIDGGVLTLSQADQIPSGADWTTLMSLGWEYEITT